MTNQPQARSGMGAIRDLHAPEGDTYKLACRGCDAEGYEAEEPSWPCRTAELVYSEVEIADTLATYESWRKWVRDAEMRKSKASGWSINDDINQLMVRTLIRRPSIDRFFEFGSPTLSVAKYAGAIQVSREMLDD